jgi:hypothetical protein
MARQKRNAPRPNQTYGLTGRGAVEFLSISAFGSRSIQSSMICVTVLSLLAAYCRSLFNLRVDILTLNLESFIVCTQCLPTMVQ